jgi:hypothetical protein
MVMEIGLHMENRNIGNFILEQSNGNGWKM